MVELLLKIKQTVAETMAKGQSCLAPDQVLAFEKRYDELVEDGLALNLAPQKPPGQRGRGQTNPAKKPARPLAQSQNSRVGFYVRC